MAIIEVMGNRASVNEPGQLAQAIVDCASSDMQIINVDEPKQADFVVYARRVAETLSFAERYCSQHTAPLMIMSTGIDGDLPQNPDYPLIVAPNTGLRVLGFMQQISDEHKRLPDWDIEITEYHQATKKDVSGTAIKIAKDVDIDPATIVSVRDLTKAKQVFPELTNKDSSSYAGHVVTFTDPNSGQQQTHQILVVGRKDYGEGVITIYRALQRPEVQRYIADHNNVVNVVQLLQAGFIEA